jgi:spermidine synthase
VIGFASGWTTGSTALHSAPTRIDVAEIEPAVIRASRHFEEHNHRPLDDPRVHLYLNDARNHLLLTADGTYDLVICEPSNPWLSGVSNLFTREFFALGKRKLADGGVWAQWIQMYGLSPVDVRSLLATFTDAYASVFVFRVSGGDLVVLGSDRPLSLDTAAIRDVLTRSTAVADDLKAVQVGRTEDVLGLYLFGRDTVLQLAGDVERNTDDNMRIEYSAPLSIHASTEAENLPMLYDAAIATIDAVSTKAEIVALARAYARTDPTGRRALFTAEEALARFPYDASVAGLYGEIQRTMAQRAQQ